MTGSRAMNEPIAGERLAVVLVEFTDGAEVRLPVGGEVPKRDGPLQPSVLLP